MGGRETALETGVASDLTFTVGPIWLRQLWRGDSPSSAPSNLGLAEPTSTYLLYVRRALAAYPGVLEAPKVVLALPETPTQLFSG